MDQPLPPAPLHDPRAPRLVERRRHPRVDGAELAATVSRLRQEDSRRRSRPAFHRVLAVFARLRPFRGRGGYGAELVAARRARLPRIADRLEAILAELDALEVWREASDVCAAIERLRARAD